MSMRITNTQLTTSFLDSVRSRRQDVADLQERLATGRRILKPSDSPDGAIHAMRTRNQMDRLSQRQNALAMSQRHLGMIDSTLGDVASSLVEAKGLVIQASNDSSSAAERASLGLRVDGLIRDITALSNTRLDDVYLFGGTDTRTPPYTLSETDGLVDAVTAHTSETAERKRNLGDGETIAINMDGSWVFNRSVDIFGALIGLRDALRNNDSASIRATLETMDTAIDQVNQASVEIGNRMKRVTLMEQQAADEGLNLQAAQSTIEDVAVSETFIKLRSTETALEAALTAGSRLIPQSLLDFIR